ncbi:DNA repair photolyase-like protein [Caldicellulosiruptor acetigenus I77R1B]|uniref:DNA repair photolyase-like protein n=1 Tax=Caldicellulosiruptor acetigenus (strain ATCC 700853 / DSM 12137 / I77R1B) TaxID=632335 RepID=E4S6Q6_CALA7|nr:deoxyribodipyrimidine photo-lyase [Caldicellulosiruptor acetigenus]ADQ40671.1 DNA repair photolyase-like protein [Caldicellulosiruptor acetigenus I77R1B]
MKNSKNSLLAKHFSHIYIEREIISHPITKIILDKFPNSVLVEIDNYKEVFSRPRQNYKLQEISKKLILAKKKGEFLYPGPPLCHDFGYNHFYYTSLILNCIFSCDYCFLKGMYSSANIVIFVNIEDYFEEIDSVLKRHPLYLSVSYDTDIMAFEKIVPFCTMFIEYATSRKDLTIEIRTKTANYEVLQSLKPPENVILAWTLSPQEIIEEFEHKTPSLSARLDAIKKAIENEWNVRLCFDPILFTNNWKEIYLKFINNVFEEIQPSKITDISVGVFRIPKDFLKRMKKVFKNEIPLFPYEEENGVFTYPYELKKEMMDFFISNLSKFVPKSKIFVI